MAKPDYVVAAHDKYGLPLAFDRARNSLITGGFDGSIGIWSIDDWSERRRSRGDEQRVNCGGLFWKGHLVTGSTDTTARIWELPGLERIAVFEGHTKTVAGLATHPSDERIATASYDSIVRVWNTETDRDPLILDGHSGNVTSVEFVGDSDYLVSGGIGDELVVWSLEDGDEQTRLGGHGQAVVGVTVDPDGQIWSAGYNGTLHSWSGGDWSPEDAYELPFDARPSGLTAHPTEPRLAVSRDGGVSVFSSQGELVTEHETSIKGISMPLWSPDGTWLVVGGADGKIRIYE